MRCFKGAARKQHLEEEVKWLQQMLAKEQQSKQAVLGQLQDEKAKCAMLEMEILHAAQAAQEMGESLCLFFNPCYQQSEQQLLQLAHQSAEDDFIMCEQAILHPPLEQEGCWQPYQQPNSLQLTQQQQQQMQEQEPLEQQNDPPCDPDTAAHDQAVHRTKELSGPSASNAINLTQPDPQLNSPCRSLKGSPGRRNSPHRRSGACRSLRLSSSSSPVKQAVLAAAATAADSKGYKQAADLTQGAEPHASKETPAAASAATASSIDNAASQALGGDQGPPLPRQHMTSANALAAGQPQMPYAQTAALAEAQFQQLHLQPVHVQQQQAQGVEAPSRPAGMDAAAGVSAHGLAHAPTQQCQLPQQQQKQQPALRDHNKHPSRVQAQLEGALAVATATAAAAQAAPPQTSGLSAAVPPSQSAASKLPLSAAAAAAAAIQQSVSAASAAIAAAEAARSNPRAFPVHPLAPFGSINPGAGPGNAMGVPEPVHAASSTTSASSSNTGSSTSSKSACDATSHKLPLGIVSDAAAATVSEEAVSTGQVFSKAASPSVAAQESGSSSSTGPQHVSVSCGHTSSVRAAASLCSSGGSCLLEPLSAQHEVGAGRHSSSSSSSGGCSDINSANAAPLIVGGPPAAGACVAGLSEPQARSDPQPSLEQTRGSPMAPEDVEPGEDAAAAELACVVSLTPAAAQQPNAPGSSQVSNIAAPHMSGSTSSAIPAAASSNRSSGSPAAAAATAAVATKCTPPDSTVQQLIVAAGSVDADMAAAGGVMQPAIAAATGTPDRQMVVTVQAGHSAVNCNSSIGTHGSNNVQQPPQQQQQQQHRQGSVNMGLQVPALATKLHIASRLSLPAHAGPTTGSTHSSSWHVPATADSRGNPSCAPGLQMNQQMSRGGGTHADPKARKKRTGAMHKQPQVLRLSQQQQQQQQQQQSRLHLQAGWGYKSITRSGPLGASHQALLLRPRSLGRRTAATTTTAPTATDTHIVAVLPNRKPAAAEAVATASGARALGGSMVAAAAGANPASCLSPLHWHQSNLGSSRGDFYQAMMLSACSNPSSVMRQQLAFDELDSHSSLRAVAQQLGSKGAASGTSVKGSINKPRKRWMALF